MSFQRISVYRCKSGLLPGKNYAIVSKIAHRIFHEIQCKTKRRPYVRSTYFDGEKIFLDNFWPHLKQKAPKQQYRRLKLLKSALELIQKSKFEPTHELREEKSILYRFIGEVSEKFYFAVQIKEDFKRKQKFFMSAFEIKK